MDVTNLTQFENIIIDCSAPPTADTTIAVDAFVQPVVLTLASRSSVTRSAGVSAESR